MISFKQFCEERIEDYDLEDIKSIEGLANEVSQFDNRTIILFTIYCLKYVSNLYNDGSVRKCINILNAWLNQGFNNIEIIRRARRNVTFNVSEDPVETPVRITAMTALRFIEDIINGVDTVIGLRKLIHCVCWAYSQKSVQNNNDFDKGKFEALNHLKQIASRLLGEVDLPHENKKLDQYKPFLNQFVNSQTIDEEDVTGVLTILADFMGIDNFIEYLQERLHIAFNKTNYIQLLLYDNNRKKYVDILRDFVKIILRNNLEIE